MRRSLSLIAVALTLAGCGTAAVQARDASDARQTGASAAAGTAELGIELLRRLPEGNLVFSPDSIAAAIAMAGVGARGETASQIAHTLYAGSAAALASFGALQAQILAEQAAASRGAREPTQISIANTLFAQKGLSLEGPFLQTLDGSFGVVPQLVDFEHDLPGATKAIDEWVDGHTGGAIPSIATSIPPETRMALVNALYLQALWGVKIDEDPNKVAFHAPHGTQRVPFLGETEPLRYGHGGGYSAVSLPYQNSTLALLLLLPDRTGSAGLREVQRKLSGARLNALVARMREQPVVLAFPSFQIDTHVQLASVLSALGMARAVSDTAEFGGISQMPLKIGEVLHAADIRVNERGTTAAAATVETFEPLSATIYRHTVRFDANRPFLFFLRDRRTGAVLFAGRLANAAAAPTPAPGFTKQAKEELGG
jgi:serpin B